MKKEQFEIQSELMRDIPQFDLEKIKEYTKNVVYHIYHTFLNNDLKNLKVRISDELINKITNNKELYRISNDFERIVVDRIGLCGYEKKDGISYVKMFANVSCFDDVDENGIVAGENDKTWYDRWIITFQALSNIDNNCKNCGSEMEYDKENDVYVCKFCRSVFYKDSKDWKIVDIEVEK